MVTLQLKGYTCVSVTYWLSMNELGGILFYFMIKCFLPSSALIIFIVCHESLVAIVVVAV